MGSEKDDFGYSKAAGSEDQNVAGQAGQKSPKGYRGGGWKGHERRLEEDGRKFYRDVWLMVRRRKWLAVTVVFLGICLAAVQNYRLNFRR